MDADERELALIPVAVNIPIQNKQLSDYASGKEKRIADKKQLREQQTAAGLQVACLAA